MNANNFTALRMSAERSARRLMLLLGRGRVKLTRDNDQGPVQKIQAQISAKETMDLLRVAEFGFASRLPKDSDVVVVFLNAERTYAVAIASNHQKHRMELENDGESAVHDAFGRHIWFRKDGAIEIDANDLPIEIKRAKKVTVAAGDDGVQLDTTGNVVLNMGGKDLTVNNPGKVQLTGAGGRKVVCDGDLVVGGVCKANAGQKVTAT